jgi:hypothetical protein
MQIRHLPRYKSSTMPTTFMDIAIKLILAVIIGGAIGAEREYRSPAYAAVQIGGYDLGRMGRTGVRGEPSPCRP